MGYKIKLNRRVTSLDVELPMSQGELEYQLREHYPGCYIDSNNWPRYIAVPEHSPAVNRFKPSYDPTSTKFVPCLYATTKRGVSKNPLAAHQSDILLWGKLDGHGEKSPLAPAFELLKGDKSMMPTLWAGNGTNVKVALEFGTEMTVPITDDMDGSELIAAVAAICRLNAENVLLVSVVNGAEARGVNVQEGFTLIKQRIFPGQELVQERIDGKALKSGNYNIFVKTLAGKTMRLSVNALTEISELKRQIQGVEGIPMDEQRLIFKGKQLEHSYNLKDYEIGGGSTVHLVTRLRGGMFHLTSGREDFEDLDAVEEMVSAGGIPLQVRLPDCSVLLMDISNGEKTEDIKARIAAMLCEREAEKAAKELAAVDVDSINDVATLQAMLRRVQKRLQEL